MNAGEGRFRGFFVRGCFRIHQKGGETMKAKLVVLAGVFVALGVLIPYVFHVTGIGGTVFLPMHIPVLLGATILPPGLAALVGIVSPVLSHLATGMPPVFPVPIMPLMVIELGVMGAVMSLLARHWRLNLWLALIGAMVAGRIALGLGVIAVAPMFGVDLHPIHYVWGGLVTGLPGIAIQLVVIPPLARKLFLSREGQEALSTPGS